MRFSLINFIKVFLALFFIGFLIFVAANREETRPGELFLHQDYIKELYGVRGSRGFRESEGFPKSQILGAPLPESPNIGDPSAVFWYVFSQLPEEVIVYPSENYYYFSFQFALKEIWGNIRLSPPERDQGILHFAYWEYRGFRESEGFPKSQILGAPPPETLNTEIERAFSKYKQFSQKDGLRVEKLGDFRYAATYRGKTVIFNLFDLPQTPPQLAKLRDNEVFVQRTFDESGFRFFLVFLEDRNRFIYVFDEEVQSNEVEPQYYGGSTSITSIRIPESPNIVVDGRTGFIFYDDQSNNRKILIGVSADNINKNNYFDGPFDQLADNYVQSSPVPVGYYIQKAYPNIRGRVDDYGRFLDAAGSRVAITPYRTYSSLAELTDLVNSCEQTKPLNSPEFYACITVDSSNW